jgi:hypothetical protein
LAGVVVLVSALITIAFNKEVPSPLVKCILFLLAQVIACIGLRQTVGRAFTVYLIASYLRIFVEPKTAGLKWQSRLKIFREGKPDILKFRHYEFELSAYLLLIIFSFFLAAGHFIYEFWGSHIIYLLIVIMITVVVLIVTVCFLCKLLKSYKSYISYSGKVFEPTWKEVEQGEQGQYKGGMSGGDR